MDVSRNHYVEESLLRASANLGKGLIQQCLQQEVLPSDGTIDVLPGACQALAEAILRNVQMRIWEDGCVTQKEILSYACRELAKLIKVQCPRGYDEMERLQGRLALVLSEATLAEKLAKLINTRELVECVCSQHGAGLKTVLLSACQWLINDMQAIFAHNDSCIRFNKNDKFSKNGRKENGKEIKHHKQVEFLEEREVFNMLINNHENQFSYIIALINAEMKQRCCTTVLNLWRLLVKKDAFVHNELYDEKICYLITFGRRPVHSLKLLCLEKQNDNGFKDDVMIQEVGLPVWPKDKSVIKRWFPDPRDQAIEERSDHGNQCIQTWKIGSKTIAKRHPNSISSVVLEKENPSFKSQMVQQNNYIGCFQFSKHIHLRKKASEVRE
ncbi:hypothetical protein XELAEV_18038945mg [Xenopus laevis]|uniref:Uncharacterized protein n=1 Tax=Xenopus laevis TaxID=8355 RepID=A0A974C6Y9_XENLA|nr:hypothetical protein XELAEV_18038945mg [Xenopus laevis]